MSTFSDELTRLMEIGDMTLADLQHWFARPHPTVRSWVELGRTPRGPAGKLAWDRLRLLGDAVEYRQGLPAPRNLSAQARPAYIKQVRDGLERTGVLKNNSA